MPKARPMSNPSDGRLVLSDGSTIDVRRMKVMMFAVFQAYGKQVRSVSDLPRNETLDRLFGEDDRPVNDREIVEETAALLGTLKEQDRELRRRLKRATGLHRDALVEEAKVSARILQKLTKFIDGKREQP
jgi:hypothetical protein